MGAIDRIELPERYRPTRHIASGGMASVWEAEDLLLRRTVAIKVLGAEFAADRAARRRFQREARTAAQISDRRHIVTIYDIGEHGDEAFIVMEYFAGGTVADRLAAARRADGVVARATALRWLREAAIGLDVAHAAGIVHRDVKPGNLMLDTAERLAVGDFGIARLADDTQMTQAGQVLGTAAYLSPEQALGRPATAASDRYALAVVAYELLTGGRPFASGPPTVLARQHVETAPAAASLAGRGLPSAVDAVLARGLAKEAGERPTSGAAFVAQLEHALAAPAAARGPAAPDPTRARTPTTAPPQPIRARGSALPEPAPSPRPAAAPPQRARRAWAAVLVAGVAAIGVVAALLAGNGDAPARHAVANGARTHASHAKRPARSQTTAASAAPAGTTAPSAGAAATNDPVALDARGYGLIEQGDDAAAVPFEQRAVDGFRAGGDRSSANYAYALYNLGTALDRSGRPADAIAYLQERLRISDDRPGLVRKELVAAQQAAGGGPAQHAAQPQHGDAKAKPRGARRRHPDPDAS